MKVIALDRGLFTKVSDEDYERLVNFGEWKVVARPNNKFHVYVYKNNRTVYMHKLIVSAKSVDHIDGDGLNNQRDNLRSATLTQQSANTGIRTDNTSGYKGVSWHRLARKWLAQINVEGKYIYIGLYLTAYEASVAYDKAAQQYFGEYARTNEMIHCPN